MQILNYTRLFTKFHSATFRNFRIVTVRKDTFHITPFWSFRAGPRSGHALLRAIPFFFCALVCSNPCTIRLALHTCLRAGLTVVMAHVELRGSLPCSESSLTTCHRLRSSAHRAGSVFVNAPPLRTFVRLCIFEWTWSAREVRVG